MLISKNVEEIFNKIILLMEVVKELKGRWVFYTHLQMTMVMESFCILISGLNLHDKMPIYIYYMHTYTICTHLFLCPFTGFDFVL